VEERWGEVGKECFSSNIAAFLYFVENNVLKFIRLY